VRDRLNAVGVDPRVLPDAGATLKLPTVATGIRGLAAGPNICDAAPVAEISISSWTAARAGAAVRAIPIAATAIGTAPRNGNFLNMFLLPR
jgi:hypothetical protein